MSYSLPLDVMKLKIPCYYLNSLLSFTDIKMREQNCTLQLIYHVWPSLLVYVDPMSIWYQFPFAWRISFNMSCSLVSWWWVLSTFIFWKDFFHSWYLAKYKIRGLYSFMPLSLQLKGCCWTNKDAGILGLWRRRLHSRARNKPWSLRAEIDAFLELSSFFGDPADVGNLISGSSAFSKTSLNIWKFTVHVLLKAGLGEFWALLY